MTRDAQTGSTAYRSLPQLEVSNRWITRRARSDDVDEVQRQIEHTRRGADERECSYGKT